MQDFQQTLTQILDYVKGIWIKKRYIMICSWLLCPIGFFYVASLPDVYESKSVVFVDTRSVLAPLLRGLAVQSDPESEIQVMARTLLSRSNVEKIARESDLDITVQTELEFEKLVTELQNTIQLRSTSRTNIYTISYRHERPEVAQNVVQETLDLFVEGSLGNNRRDNDTAGRFLNEQIAEYETRLAEAEQRLADFKRQYNNILPLQGTFYTNLASLNGQLEQVQLEIRQTQQQIASMRGQLTEASTQTSDGLGVSNNDEFALKTRYDDRILALEEKIDGLRLRFTDLHPDVVEAQNLLASLEQARKKEIDAFLSGSDNSDSSGQLNTLNNQIKLEMSLLEGQVASLKVKELSIVSKIQELESKIDLVPQVEAEAAALNRDYGITQNKYEELLSRREAADLSRRADVSAEDLQFRIIEPPLLATEPSGPNRFVFYTAVLIAGFGAGIALAFLVSQLTPVLIRDTQLVNMTHFPVWGVVTHLDIAKIRKKERLRLLIFIVSSGGVFALYTMLIAAEILNINLLQRFVL